MKQLILFTTVVMLIASCEREKQECPGSTEKTIALSNFTTINAAETFAVSVLKGSSYSIKAKGCANDLADLEVSVQQGGLLDIHYAKFSNHRQRVNVEITMPELAGVNMGGASSGRIAGFDLQTSTINATLSGTAKCEINAAPQNILFDLSGTSELNVQGRINTLKGKVNGAAYLDAYGTNAATVEVRTEGTAKAKVIAVESLSGTASGASRIYYKGIPANIHVEEAGAGKVIHE